MPVPAREPRTAVVVVRPRSVLPEVFETLAAERGDIAGWGERSLPVRGSLRVMWALARSGQSDPWVVALAGLRYRSAFTGATRNGRWIAEQYLAMATRIVDVVATGHTGRTGRVA